LKTDQCFVKNDTVYFMCSETNDGWGASLVYRTEPNRKFKRKTY